MTSFLAGTIVLFVLYGIMFVVGITTFCLCICSAKEDKLEIETETDTDNSVEISVS